MDADTSAMLVQPRSSNSSGGKPSRFALISVLAVLAGMVVTPAAGADPASFKGASDDGAIAVFTTAEKLIAGDTDNHQDVYVRYFDDTVGEGGEYVTRRASIGPLGGNDARPSLYNAISADGSRVFFETDESLVAADTDGQRRDVYVRDVENNTTSLVSQGAAACQPGCGNGPVDTGFVGFSPDGSRVFMVTLERLAPADTDDFPDVYVRDLSAESTELVSAAAAGCSTPDCGNGDFEAVFWGASADGTTAFFTSREQLHDDDQDSAFDIYARDVSSDQTMLVSRGAESCAPGCGNSGAVPVFGGSSADGKRVFFTTDEQLAGGDSDMATDVYARDLPAGPTLLVSAGADSAKTASFVAASADGATALFTTTESLVGADENGAVDIYRWSGGGPQLVTSGTCVQGSSCGSTFRALSADDGTVVFTTNEPLLAADEDTSVDIYAQELESGARTLVSQGNASCAPECGNGQVQANFNAISADGSRVLFSTAESLTVADADSDRDIYAHDSGTGTSVVSPVGVCPIPAGCEAVFAKASSDGGHVFFQTTERLTAEDVDSEVDVYERDGSETRLVSAGNSAVLGPSAPVLTGTDPPSPGESTTPSIRGQADPETSIKLYVTADCSGTPVATGTSAELYEPGITVTVAEGSTTSFRATAEDANGDTSPCSEKVTYKQQTETTPPPPPPPPPPPDEGGGSGDGGGSGTGTGGKTKPRTGGGSGAAKKNIVYVAPETRITFGPSFKTRRRKVVFQFADATGQPGTSFICRLDRRRWRPCSSPIRLRRLRRGRHVFKVKGVNALGAWEAKPVARRFKVVGKASRRGKRSVRRGRP